MTGDVLPLLLAIACLFLTPAASLPSKTGNSKSSRDISHTDLERFILNTIGTVETQNRPHDEETEGTPWKAENTPTLPDLIKDWKERRESLTAGDNFLRGLEEDDADIIDKRGKDYGWGFLMGKRNSRTQSQSQQSFQMETKKDHLYGWGTTFGKRGDSKYGWGQFFGKRNGEDEVDYDDFVAL